MKYGSHKTEETLGSQRVNQSEYRILLIDDSDAEGFYTRSLLHKSKLASYDIVWANSLVDGFTELERREFDLLLLDLSFSELEGLDVFKEFYDLVDMPIVLLSDPKFETVAIEAVQLGAQDYLIKSGIDERHLEQAICFAIERFSMMNELKKAKEEVEVASQAKSEFLSLMSHEFRTPLNGLIGGLDLISELNVDTEVVEIVDMMSACAAKQRQLIDDLLCIIELDSSDFESHLKLVCIHDLIDSVVHYAKQKAKRKGVQVASKVAMNVPMVAHLDGESIRQVFVHLIDNAVKFTEVGHIYISVYLDGAGNLVFSVLDTGIGISDCDIERVFSPFTQLDSTFARQVNGAGLGLAISKRLVEFMGGDMTVTSLPGEGSNFQFTLMLDSASISEISMVNED